MRKILSYGSASTAATLTVFILAVASATFPALAVEAASAAVNTTIDLSGLMTSVIQLAVVALIGLGGVLIRVVTRKLQVEQYNFILENALARACNAAEAQLIKKVGKLGLNTYDTHNTAVAAAYQFLQTSVPDVLAKQGITQEQAEALIAGYFTRVNPAVVSPGNQSLPEPKVEG